jgi:hypothetical protein
LRPSHFWTWHKSKPERGCFMPFEKGPDASAHAHLSWAHTPNRFARTAPGRAAADAALEAKLDPDGVMSKQDRAKALKNLRQAHMLRMSRLAAEKRAAKAATKKKAAPSTPGDGQSTDDTQNSFANNVVAGGVGFGVHGRPAAAGGASTQQTTSSTTALSDTYPVSNASACTWMHSPTAGENPST